MRSAETNSCPCCGGALEVIGSRKRKAWQSSGEPLLLVIRRLRCVRCRRIHHELPDLLVPYKRYTADSIEPVVSGEKKVAVAADDSTIRRWRSWFFELSSYLAGCLVSIAIRFFSHLAEALPPSAGSALQRIWHYTGSERGWLKRVVRSVTNATLWRHTRSACLSG